MADNHVREGFSAGEDDVVSPVAPIHGAAAEGSGDSLDQMDPPGLTNRNSVDSSGNEPNDTRTAEDGARDDMFVDCPDEIENSESQQNSEEMDTLQDDHFNESDSGIKVQQLMAELEHLRESHEKSVAEKENYEAERAVFMTEISDLRSQLKVHGENEISSSQNTNGTVDHGACLEKDQQFDERIKGILSYLSMSVGQGELFDESLTVIDKISNIERLVAYLVEMYTVYHSGTNQLRGCMTEIGSDFNMTDELGILVSARDKLLELKRKEDSLFQNLSHFDNENRKLIEQLEKQRIIVENANAEIVRLNAEVEQEKNRYANTKEKLGMAVTKGKALVQQRDSLKQLLAEKTTELGKCLTELQEKSSALEAAEQTNEMLAASEKFAAYLQESLAEKDNILQNCEELFSEVEVTEELPPMDIAEKLRWLANENKTLNAISLQYHKLMEALVLIDFPETMASSELDTRVRWLVESFNLSKEETLKLQSEIAELKQSTNQQIDRLTALLTEESQERSNLQAELEVLRNMHKASERLYHELAETREAANIEIDLLTKSLVAESEEKNYLQAELEDVSNKYEEIVQKGRHISLEKDQIVNVLLEASGLADDDKEKLRAGHSDLTNTIDTCLVKIKEKACQIESPQVDIQIFESFQSLLCVTDLEMRLYKLIAEEDVLSRTEVDRLSHELGIRTQELNIVMEEKAVMQKSFEQLEDRCGLLKDKLSMAVKKGKGLVQERENLKGSLNEKNTEIDRLKSELLQSLSAYDECQDKITKLSLDVERISQLENDIVATKERAGQLEQFLAESNNMLQRVMESIEDITAPVDLNVKEPVEKVKWLAGYIRDHETEKMEMEQELNNVKDEAKSLTIKLSEAMSSIKSLEDALSTEESNLSQIFDEKKELEVSKAVMEAELRKEKEEVSSCTSKFEEVSTIKRALEDALQLSENNISRFMNERDIALDSKVLAEEQLQKLKDEFSTLINRHSDAEKTIKSLEDAVSQEQLEASLLAEENNKLQIGRADLENEIKKMTEEASSQASKLSDASLTIQSLKDALSNAENNLADLIQKNKNAEQEILVLDTKLKSCMEELAGTRGSEENWSAEISGQLARLQSLLNDETLSSSVNQWFAKKIESLNTMNFIIKEIGDIFLEMDSDVLQNISAVEDDTSVLTNLPSSAEIALNMDTNDEVNVVDGESIKFHIVKMNELFHLKNKMLADKFDRFSALMDESIVALSRRLHMNKVGLVNIVNYVTSLKQQVKDMETDKQSREETITSLENDIRILSSACADATKGIKSNLHKSISELRSIREVVELDDRNFTILAAVGGDAEEASLNDDHVKLAEKLLLATTHNQDLGELIQDVISKLFSITEDVQNKLRHIEITCHEVSEERDLYKENISKLEIALEAKQNLCQEMKLKLDGYLEKQDQLKKREAELSSLSKTRDLEDSLLSPSQVKSILRKINEVEVPDSAYLEPNDSADIRKLFYVIDDYKKLSSLSHGKGEVQSTTEKQILEIDSLKKKIKEHVDNEKESEKMFTDLLELESGLKSIVRKMEGRDLIDEQKASGVLYLLPLLDKLVMAKMMESDNLQSKNEQLVTKLIGSQKVVDDLSYKVKLLEDYNQARSVPPEIDQERGTSLPSLSTQPEISELQDMVALGISNNVPVPSAAHVRTLRKGSSDHLAINIDSDSERLLNNKEPDDDKGHVFKSLNMSGLIPRQGRTVADRFDGIWVSGSRTLMSHPRGRLGLVAYWLVLHIWLLGTIL